MINETDYTNNPLTKEQENQIDDIFKEYDTTDKPGCSVGVIKNGRFIYKKSFGMANLDYNIPLTADSVFNLASVSKQFTAACIALLITKHKLNLDDDIRKYVHELPDYGNTIKISHLLFHTSGIKDFESLMMFSDISLENYFKNDDAFKIICKQNSLNFIPGERHEYSNSGYLLLAIIVRRVSGLSIREFAEKNIFTPLDMKNTLFNDDCRAVIKNRVIPYDISQWCIHFYLQNNDVLGDSNVFSTMNDLLKWNNNFYKPVIGGNEFLELMRTKGVLNNNEEIEYGFGLIHSNWKGNTNIAHAGESWGILTNFERFPDQEIGIIVLCNREDVDQFELASNIAKIIVPENPNLQTQIPQTSQDETYIPEIIELSNSELEKFCGYYWEVNLHVKREIYLKNGNLYFWRGEESESRLLPINENEFIMEGIDPSLKIKFEVQNNQKTIEFYLNDKHINTYRSYTPINCNKEYLNRYAGSYYSQELDIEYNLKLESESLVVFKKDKKVSELKIFVPNIFIAVELSAAIEFSFDENNLVSCFIMGNERALNVKFYKK